MENETKHFLSVKNARNIMIEDLNPIQCWDFLQGNPNAIMVDVRTTIEHSFVGHPPDAIHIAWKEFPGMKLNEQFIEQINSIVSDKSISILLLCRSGVRSLAAANALDEEGYLHLINIVEGFEGELDAEQHRGNINGWRFYDLPWVQS